MMLRRTWLLAIVSLLVLSLVLTGCGQGAVKDTDTGTDDTGGETPVQGDKPTDEGHGILRYATTAEGKTLNPHAYTSNTESGILGHCSATLYRTYPAEDGTTYERRAELADGDPIQVDDEGKVWHIKINKDAKWANGEPINADTFMYTYKMLIDPKLMNRRGANFAEGVVVIENATDYFMQLTEESVGEVDWEDVGIKKVDDHTIEIRTEIKQLEADIKQHFSTTSSAPVYEPLYEELMNEDRTETAYGIDDEKFMSSGPFVLDSWVKDNERKFSKNPHFVNKDLIWLAGIHNRVIPDKGTQMQMFNNGELDYVTLSAEDFIQYEEDPRVLFAPTTSVRHITLNTGNPDQPILANKNFRKALFYAMDRGTMANDLGKHRPANYIISSRKVIDIETGTRWRDMDEANEYLAPNYGYDPELALEYFEKALEEEGIDKVSLQLNYYDNSEEVKKMSEYMQKSLPEIFGEDRFELKLQSLPSNQRTAAMKDHKTDPRSYEMSWAGWTGTEFDPWNTMRVYTSDYSSKNEPFSNERLDELYHEVNHGESKYDQDAKIEITAELEQIMLEELPIIPIYETVEKYLKADRIQLPVKEWVNGAGFGWRYAKIVE